MRIQQFLERHGVATNPFAEEDAQTDLVFKEHCIASTYHPAWDKIYGDPAEPTTSIVFGEKGAGKTALRLQIARHLDQYNRDHHGRRLFVIEYDDFNPFLDRFRDRLTVRRRRADRALSEWKLWDHMDAILALGVTMLVDRMLEVSQPSGPAGFDVSPAEVSRLDRYQARDLLLLAACYDQSTAETIKGRWHRLRRKLGFSVWRAQWDLAVGIVTTVAVVLLSLAVGFQGNWSWSISIWPYLMILAGWSPRLWRMIKWWYKAWGIARHVRVGKHAINPLRQVLMNFTTAETTTQPLPDRDRTDDRYELMIKLQGILKTLGYSGIVVLVDRVDEPHLINGSAEQMRALVWPLLDNKFLKQPGVGFKLLLPIDLSRFVDRESRDFYERARLDKQNLVPSLEWTGEALYDLANARLRVCAVEGAQPKLRDLFVESVSEQRLLEALRSLRVPRHVFKFMYRLLVAHCNTCTDERPIWKVSSEQFESMLALYLRDQDAFERGLKTV